VSPTLLLDVNETLSDMGAVGARFAELGVPREAADAWFAAVLRDGFALAVAGTSAPFAALATDGARRLLAAHGHPDPEAGAAQVLETFTSLDVHPDVGPGLAALRAGGVRVATLSNGAAAVAQGLLERAGLSDLVEATLSVEEAGVWKPARAAYLWACERLGTAPADTMLVAVHPWDTDGARRAGLQAAYVDRAGSGYPGHFTPPTITVASFVGLAESLQTQ
jgi:2-haloacid dehalogenase